MDNGSELFRIRQNSTDSMAVTISEESPKTNISRSCRAGKFSINDILNMKDPCTIGADRANLKNESSPRKNEKVLSICNGIKLEPETQDTMINATSTEDHAPPMSQPFIEKCHWNTGLQQPNLHGPGHNGPLPLLDIHRYFSPTMIIAMMGLSDAAHIYNQSRCRDFVRFVRQRTDDFESNHGMTTMGGRYRLADYRSSTSKVQA